MRTLGAVAVALALTLGAPVQAGSVAYKDTTGVWANFGAGATWSNVQTAITTAQGGGGGGRGEVRIEGNITRVASDATTSLSVGGAGSIDISGGWDAVWTTRDYTAKSVLDAAVPTLATTARVLGVSTANVTLGNVQLKNGGSYGAMNGCGLYVASTASGLRVTNATISNNGGTGTPGAVNGGGVFIDGANDVKLTNTVITANSMHATYSGGGTGSNIYIQNAGTAAAPVVLEYCTISAGGGASGSTGNYRGLVATGTSNITVADSLITTNGPYVGSAIYTSADKLTVFGTLIVDNNSGGDWTGAGGNVIMVNQPNGALTSEPLVLANTTFVNNHLNSGVPNGDNGVWNTIVATPAASGAADKNLVLLSNTIVTSTIANYYDTLTAALNGAFYGHMLLQNSSVGADTAPTVKVQFNTYGTILADMTDALGTAVGGRYGFQSLDAAGNLVANPGAAANIEMDLKNLGVDNLVDPNPANWTYKYQLKVTDANVNNGTLKDAGGVYQYIDINHNGAFDANTDIVVGGTPPVGALFVYKYDASVINALQSGRYYLVPNGTDIEVWDRVLAAKVTPNRVRGTIDRGAYETDVLGAVYWKGDSILKWNADNFDDAAVDAGTNSGSTVVFDDTGLTQAVSVQKGTGTGPTAGTVRFSGTLAYTLSSPDGAVLNLQAAAGSAYLLAESTSVDHTINCNVNLVSNTIADMGVAGQGVIIAGNVIGAGSLTKDGAGTLTLQGAGNVYGGGTFVSSGILNVSAGSSLSTGAVTVNGGLLKVLAGGSTGTGAVVVNGGSLRMDAGATLPANTVTITGTGTLDLGADLLGTVTGVTMSAGFIQVNATTQNMGVVPLTMTGGTINGTGTITRTNDYTLGAGTVNAILGQTVAPAVQLVKNTAGVLTLNNIANSYSNGTRVDAGTLVFGANVPAAGNSVVGAGTFTLNGGTLAAGAAGLVFSRDVAVTANSFLAGSGGNSFTVAGNLTGGAFIAELPTGFANTVTLTGTGGTLAGGVRVTAGTLAFGATVPAVGNSVVGTGTLLMNGGILAAASAGLDFGKPIQLTANSTVGGTSSYSISGVISQNVAGRVLTKANTSTVELTGPNSYTGNTVVTAGALRAQDGTGLPALSNLQLNGGVFESNGTFIRTTGAAAGNVQWTSTGGFSAKGGILTVKLNNDATNIKVWAAGSFVPTGQSLLFCSATADNLVDFQNPINLADAARTVQVDDNTTSGFDYARISGYITSTTPASGALTKTGAGTLELTGTNLYTGLTTISAGALRAVDGTGLPAASVLTLNGGVFETNSGLFNRSLTTLATGGGVRWTAAVSGGFAAKTNPLLVQLNGGTAEVVWAPAVATGFLTTGALILGSVTADNVVDFQNNIDLNNAARTVQVNDNLFSANDYAKLSGTIRSSVGAAGLTKTGTGLLELAGPCTYTGVTTVNGGTLRVATTLPGSVTVNATGRLAGVGPVNGFTVALNGIVGPGASPGTLYSNAAVTMNTGSIYEYEITTPTVHDLVAVTGALTLGDNWILRLMDYGGNGIGPADQLDVFTYTGVLSVHLAGVKLDRVTIDTSLLSPIMWDTSGVGVYSDATGKRIYLTGLVYAGPVPEPAALGILLLGLPLVIRRRRA